MLILLILKQAASGLLLQTVRLITGTHKEPGKRMSTDKYF